MNHCFFSGYSEYNGRAFAPARWKRDSRQNHRKSRQIKLDNYSLYITPHQQLPSQKYQQHNSAWHQQHSSEKIHNSSWYKKNLLPSSLGAKFLVFKFFSVVRIYAQHWLKSLCKILSYKQNYKIIISINVVTFHVSLLLQKYLPFTS